MKKIYFLLILLLAITGCSDKPTLYVYSWSDYFDPELIQRFETENGCTVDITTFDSNEAMYAKLKAGGTGYDIITPSSYQILTLIKEGMIRPINPCMIPNVEKNFNHSLDNQVLDSRMSWSVPYACTYTGLMYKKDKVDKINSWKDISDRKYKGKVTLLDDIRETIGIGLMFNGNSLNSSNENEIANAASRIISWSENIRKFDAESYKLEVANGSIWIGHGYSSDAAQIIISDGRSDIGFILPDEGFTIAWDEFVVTKNSKNVELAHKFIDFFYTDDIAEQNMIYICSLMGNKNALDRLPDTYKQIFFPKNISKGQLLTDIKDDRALQAYSKAWDRVKAVKKD